MKLSKGVDLDPRTLRTLFLKVLVWGDSSFELFVPDTKAKGIGIG